MSDRAAIGGGAFETHLYSQLQAFSPDGQLLLTDGDVGQRVRNASTGDVVFTADRWWGEPRWRPSAPAGSSGGDHRSAMVHVALDGSGNAVVFETDVPGGVTRALMTIAGPFVSVGPGSRTHEEMSDDGSRLALYARSATADVVLALDVEAQAELWRFDVTAAFDAQGPCEADAYWGVWDIDWAGVTPSGDYLVIQWPADADEGSSAQACRGMEAFAFDGSGYRGRVVPGHAHGDLGVLDGADMFVTHAWDNPRAGDGWPALARYMLPPVATAGPWSLPGIIVASRIDWGAAWHVSCRASATTGTCLVTNGRVVRPGTAGELWAPYEDELWLVGLRGQAPVRLGHHYSSSCGYWVQPRASVARDGSRIVWTSDWAPPAPGGTPLMGPPSCNRGGCDALGCGDVFVMTV